MPSAKYAALLQVLRASESLWNASRVFFARWDLSPSQFNILNVLREESRGMSQTDLSRRLIMHRSNATGLIDRLEKRALVQRQPVKNDRRAYSVVLTPKGRRLIESILPAFHQNAEEIWGAISNKRIQQLIEDLEWLTRNASEFNQVSHESHR